MIITTVGNSELLAKKMALSLKCKFRLIKVDNFPDKELYLQFQIKKNELKGKKVIIVGSFQPDPNFSLLKLILAAETAKQLGAKKVVLIAPYLGFMRQDKMFNYGEAVTNKIMSKLINNSFDKIVTVDTHIHRIKLMKDIFKISAKNLTANHTISEFIKSKFKNKVKQNNIAIIGPDWESYQWAEVIAKQVGCDVTVFKKTRFSSRKVREKMIKPIEIKGKDIIIVDDIISTGHTIIEATKKVKKLGAKSVTTICVHGLFVEGAISKIKKSGVKEIITTNSIQRKESKIDLCKLLCEEIKK
ncbi:ribose-phosphate diphosphokinase [archaeon]|jgi:ribose-phosphate pyrophosphokinase|nr:ribose-phosphate diphosphokinase [archaeon]MBT3450625.1 ribose-phosphate diphosphokinase [archaeon]MBT6868689.1 ribose-phosphate diphosphokinase [archaeon]MBT7193477.1 ribose-phosphate diphosphokinase [archaeon]MBT7381068.1 ribose-phosphate diphosphokinase [archaeon]